MTIEWNEKKEKKVLRRYRFFLTLRIIRVAFMVLFLFWAYMMVVTIGYFHSTKGEKLIAYSQLAIDWQYPGISSGFGNQFDEISPILTQKASIPIYRKLGKEEKDVGYLHVKKPLMTGMTQLDFEFYQKSDEPKFHFWLPFHPETGEKLEANEHTGVGIR
ncbi:sigma factor regulator N-terminal domain-containing protein [Anaerobacillus sp. CMMVII]|uniref:sigma factor regulator N-terminal domain-containing protein n=1 Tax=Anaerobacillus sp. CMMVII TaxID=2755588 RepID=UPI0021B7E1DD|nr:sigma factor regulator N-terminal domain-containing protein [Anaerobacillus sp. CMMVII]MCT8138413.1 sigma factor regulator N-terminal domain-containing protein [Anaerobacillus sp. CMMVII]